MKIREMNTISQKLAKKKSIQIKTKKGNISVPDRLKVLNEIEKHAVLATSFKAKPYASIVSYALTKDAKGVIFATPKKTRKYKNILNNRNVALLIDNRRNNDKDYMHAEAVNIIGIAKPIRRGKTWMKLSDILIKKHSSLKIFVTFPETALILVEVKRCIHVSQFQIVSEWVVK